MGKPGKGVPVGGVTGGESPFDILPSQARLDIRILGKINVIVIANKLVIANGKINQQRGYG
jgi:hypothetical protein